jgi:imidazolonepropionase-like amidohydrolase
MSALRRQFEHVCETYQELRRRGLRVMIGGEYGHPHCPHGTNARDMEYFVRLFGYSPAEVLECATTHVAAGMRMGSELGRVKEGFVADLLLVKGRPYNDVSILQTKENISAIMQSGRFYKRSAPELRSSIRAA